MWIFIRNIPTATTKRELYRFVNEGLRPRWMPFPLSSKKRIRHCEVICITDGEYRSVEHHGLVQLDSAVTGQKAIKKLCGNKLHGRPVAVRRYFYRADQRDKRQRQHNILSERRMTDRRRQNLHVGRIENLKTEAVDGFSRIHN